MWDQLNSMYEPNLAADKFNLLTPLTTTSHRAGTDLADYMAELETYVYGLVVIDLPAAEEMQVPILLVSEMNEDSLKGKVSGLGTVDGDKATWHICSSSRKTSSSATDEAGKYFWHQCSESWSCENQR